ncbi:TetR family transcriptional regulator [Nocardia sp. NPDC003693]
MPPSALRDRKRERTRRALYEAAAELFEARGYEATTVADIAAAAEVGTRTFFNYFASKEELLFPEPDDRVSSAARAIAARTPEERPVEVLLRALRAAGDDPGAQAGDKLSARIAVIRAQVSRHIPAVSGRAAYAQLSAQQEIAQQLRAAFPEELDEVGAAALVGAVIGAVSGALTALFQSGAAGDPAELQRRIQDTTSTVLAPWLTAPRPGTGAAQPAPGSGGAPVRAPQVRREPGALRAPEIRRDATGPHSGDPRRAAPMAPARGTSAAAKASQASRIFAPAEPPSRDTLVGPIPQAHTASGPSAALDAPARPAPVTVQVRGSFDAEACAITTPAEVSRAVRVFGATVRQSDTWSSTGTPESRTPPTPEPDDSYATRTDATSGLTHIGLSAAELSAAANPSESAPADPRPAPVSDRPRPTPPQPAAATSTELNGQALTESAARQVPSVSTPHTVAPEAADSAESGARSDHAVDAARPSRPEGRAESGSGALPVIGPVARHEFERAVSVAVTGETPSTVEPAADAQPIVDADREISAVLGPTAESATGDAPGAEPAARVGFQPEAASPFTADLGRLPEPSVRPGFGVTRDSDTDDSIGPAASDVPMPAGQRGRTVQVTTAWDYATDSHTARDAASGAFVRREPVSTSDIEVTGGGRPDRDGTADPESAVRETGAADESVPVSRLDAAARVGEGSTRAIGGEVDDSLQSESEVGETVSGGPRSYSSARDFATEAAPTVPEGGAVPYWDANSRPRLAVPVRHLGAAVLRRQAPVASGEDEAGAVGAAVESGSATVISGVDGSCSGPGDTGA